MNKIFIKSLEIARAMYPTDFDEYKCRCYHISCLWDKTKLLCVGQNSAATHSRNIFNNQNNFDLGVKATCSELKCFISAKNKYSNLNWRRVKMVNVRLDRQNQIKNSKPCNFCKSLIIGYLGMKEVYYTTDKGDFEKYNG